MIAALMLLARPLVAQVSATGAPALRVISLDEAIRIALDQNATVRLAQSTSTLDSLSVRLARYQFLPNLAASAQLSQGFGNGSASSGQNSFGTGVGVSSGITLYNGGQNLNTLRGAEITLRASSQDLIRTRQSVVFTVATDFLTLITQQQLLGVQQENLTAQQQQLTQLEAFTQAGTHPIGDLYQQQAATAAAHLAVATATQATELAKVTLIEELVLDPRQSYSFVAPPADSGTGPSFNLDSLITSAIANRVDIQAESLRVEAARRAIQVAEGGRLPVISATVEYGTAANSAADSSLGRQFRQNIGGSVGVAVALPIFDRGAASIATQRARVALDNETLTLRDQVQSAALDVRRAYVNYQAAVEQIVAAGAQVKASALALQAATARYGVGASTFIEVTLARATLVQAQGTLVTAHSSLAFQEALMSYYTGSLEAANLRIGQ
jgi:outer membrane protein